MNAKFKQTYIDVIKDITDLLPGHLKKMQEQISPQDFDVVFRLIIAAYFHAGTSMVLLIMESENDKSVPFNQLCPLLPELAIESSDFWKTYRDDFKKLDSKEFIKLVKKHLGQRDDVKSVDQFKNDTIN